MPVRDSFLADKYYYISNSADVGMVLWKENMDYERFLRTALAYLEEYSGLSILAYSVIPHEYHFLFKNKNEWLNLSKFIRRLQISYAMYYQKKYSNWLNQSIFPNRFFSKIIVDAWPYSSISQKIHLLPVYQNIVQNISNWPYTSAHQVADTWYKSCWETHIPIVANISDDVKKKVRTRWREDFQCF